MLDHFIAKNATVHKVNSYYTLAISYCTFCVEKHTILGHELSVFIDKCCLFNVGKGVVSCSQYYVKDSLLPSVSSCRNLGVTINTDLSPSLYVRDIVRKAHARANMIHPCFISQNVTLLVCAFITRDSCTGRYC